MNKGLSGTLGQRLNSYSVAKTYTLPRGVLKMVNQRYFVNYERNISQLEEEEQVMIENFLTDGWFVGMDVLLEPGETVTDAGTGFYIAGFNVTEEPVVGKEFDLAGNVDYKDLFQDWLAGNIEAGVFHGSPIDMSRFYLLISEAMWADHTWLHIRKYFRKTVNAGSTIFTNNSIRGIAGSGATWTSLIYNGSVEHVVSPRKWSRTVEVIEPLKFVAVMGPMDDAKEVMQFNPPGQGYYTNLSVQYAMLGQADGQQTHMLLGVNAPDISNMGADPTTDAEVVFPDINSGIQFRFHPFYNTEGEDKSSSVLYWKHFGKQRITIRNEEDVVSLQLQGDQAITGAILIQGDFIPYQGSPYKQHVSVGAISAAASWSTVFKSHMNLSNVMIDAKVNIVFVDDFTATIYFRRIIAQQPAIVNTMTSAAVGIGDILDGDTVDSDSWSMHGIIGKIDIDGRDLAAGQEKTMGGTLQLPELNVGDLIAYDIRLTSGTISTLNLEFDLGGIVDDFIYCKNGDFLDGSLVVNGDDLGGVQSL